MRNQLSEQIAYTKNEFNRLAMIRRLLALYKSQNPFALNEYDHPHFQTRHRHFHGRVN